MTAAPIGRRLREIRLWRGLSLRAVAELAGFSASYLSLIERGQRPVDKRSTLESLAAALRVAPSELGSSFPPAGRADGLIAARTFLTRIEEALSDIEVGEGEATEPWTGIRTRLDEMAAARFRNDYTRQAELLPGLIADLNGCVGGGRRRDALQALCGVYQRAAVTAKTLGVRGLPAFAALRARQAADQLDDPAWHGFAAMVTASTSGRARAIALADRSIDALAGRLDDVRCREMAGALHLGAALSEATMGRPDRAAERLDEAERLATGIADGHGFAGMLFGPTNVRVWRLSVAVESGEGGRVRELAAGWDVRTIPVPGRHADYWSEIGRGLAASTATHEEAVAALLRAEKLAPQRIRAHPLIRETVADLHRRSRGRALDRDLRGLAWRMGVGA
ncbi:helix-turn-helix transcriptional regulator [Pseudonocardia sp. MH-G8]|uniref:helix-turn-helix domain-containing protein n=1 Tax=Pseudonocardia sp. MH-G8 TaxID=1854588 RepID=UPI00130425C5|nr:helix-turn-helix transcriptional regulator [Pseudonocardia sp. MH-G8]